MGDNVYELPSVPVSVTFVAFMAITVRMDELPAVIEVGFAAMVTVGAAAATTLKHENDKLSTIDLRVDYLAPGLARDLITEATVVKSGSKVIFTRMVAYHEHRDQPIAEGRAVFSVSRTKLP